MNDTVRLFRARIRGFRTLTDLIDISFSPKPGVTILVGPNGSGKSTVLDGIEWALTGNASRLPRLSPNSAKRAPDIFRSLGSDEDPVVELMFQEEDQSFAGIDAHTTSEEKARILRRFDGPWHEIKSVEAALLWTHFSSQRSTSRLGYEDDDTVLKALAAPSGLERFKGLDNRLWGTETRKALKELQREAESELHQHEVALEYVAKLTELPSNDDVGGLRRRIAELVGAVALDISIDLQDFNLDQLDISAIVGRFGDLDAALNARRIDLESTLAEVRHLESDRREAVLRMRRLEADLEAAQQAVDTAKLLYERRAQALNVAEQEAANSQNALERLSAERSELQDAIFVRDQRVEHEAKAADLLDRIAEMKAQTAALDKSVVRLDQLENTSVQVRAGNALLELNRHADESRNDLEFDAARDELRASIAELRQRRDTLVGERDNLRIALSAEADRLQSLTALISSLVSQLHEDDTSCPVCAAEYPAGDLLARARATVASPGPASLQLTERLNELTQRLGSVTGQLQVAERRLEEIMLHQTGRARRAAERERLERLFGGPWSPDMLETATAYRLDLLEQLALSEDDGLKEQRIQYDERRRRLGRDLYEATTELEQIKATLGTLSERQMRTGDDAQLRAELRQVEVRLERLRGIHNDHQNELRLAVDVRDSSQVQLHQATDYCSNISRDTAQERERASRIEDRVAALIGDKDVAEFTQSAQDQSIRMGLAIERLSNLRSELAQAVKSAPNDEHFELLRSRYLPESAAASSDDIRKVVTAEIERCNAQMSALSELGKRLNQRARFRRQIDQRVRGTALKPWNDLFRSVYASLAGSLGDTLEWIPDRVDMRYSELESHATPQVGGQSIHGWVPGHYFSEGQLAALQISTMITASVLMPWSRWPALLLDDPLQHADVIKVGAFADLIRSLSQDRGHQIILTTHDQVQADFIAAKFTAANLSAQVRRFERPVSGQLERRANGG